MKVGAQLKTLSKDTLNYGMGSALQKFIGFFLFPIYTRVLTTSDYGAQDLVNTAVTIITSIVILGMDSGAARMYYDATSDNERRSYLTTWLLFSLMVSVPLCGIFIVVSRPLTVGLFATDSLDTLFKIAMLVLPLSVLGRVAMLALRLSFRSRLFSLLSMMNVLLSAAFSILFVVVLRRGVVGVFLATLCAGAAFALVSLFVTRHSYRGRFSFAKLRAMLSFGIPTLPASLSIWVLTSSNRYYLARIGSLEEIGLFSVANRITSVLTFCISAFLIAWPMFAFSIARDESLARATYRRALSLFLSGTLFMGVSLSVFGREAIMLLATPVYAPASTILPWLCLGIIAWGTASVVGIGYSIAKKSYHVAIATVLGAGVNTVLNILLIPPLGIRGAAVAIAVGYLVALVYSYLAGRRYFKVPFEYSRILRLVAISIAAVAAGQAVDGAFPIWSLLAFLPKAGIFVGFGILAIIMRVVTPAEIKAAWHAVSRRGGQKQPPAAGGGT